MNICGKVESQEILARGPVWLEPDPFGAAPRPVGFNLEPKLFETYDENWFKTCNNEVMAAYMPHICHGSCLWRQIPSY